MRAGGKHNATQRVEVTQAAKSTDESTGKPHGNDGDSSLKKIEEKYGRENLARVLSNDEVSLLNEFMEESETRFSKTNIFVNYKEFHNRRNMLEEDRSKDKKFFKKQMRIVNKEKQIDKRIPCWASDIDLIRRV